VTKTGRILVWTGVGIGGLVLVGVVWAKEDPATFPLKGLLPNHGGPSSSSGVALAVQGYLLGSSGSGTPMGSVHVQSEGSTVTGVAVVSLAANSRTTQVGLRAWIVQLGVNMDSARYIVVGGYNGTVEGHLFGSPSGTTVLVDSLELQPGGSTTEQMFSQALDPAQIAWANPTAPTQYLGVIWAAGPYTDVVALPDSAGTLPTGGTVVYAVSQQAIIYP
jgi:hypothetical protein